MYYAFCLHYSEEAIVSIVKKLPNTGNDKYTNSITITNNDVKNDVIFPEILNVRIVREFAFHADWKITPVIFLHQNRSLITCLRTKIYFEVQVVVIF